MLVRILGHLRAQWAGVLALVLVLTGGVAYAANTVFSSDIVDDQVYSADVRNDTLRGRRACRRRSASGCGRKAEITDGAMRAPMSERVADRCRRTRLQPHQPGRRGPVRGGQRRRRTRQLERRRHVGEGRCNR